MSIDYTANFDAPLVTTSLTPQDEGEYSLRPRTLADYTGSDFNTRSDSDSGSYDRADDGSKHRSGS